MGAVIMFPEARRVVREGPACLPRLSATIIILPSVRIERQCAVPLDTETETTKSPSGRKRRRRASRP